MFESLTEKLNAVFKKLSRKGVLTEADVDEALREVRLALLEADVHFKVVKDFLARVREKAIGEQVHKALSPAQHRASATAGRSGYVPAGGGDAARNARQAVEHPGARRGHARSTGQDLRE